MTEAVNFFSADTEPYYLPLADEVEIFRAAYSARLPVLLKGPTGCGKTRFVEHMTWRLYRETANQLDVPLVTVSCHEDLTATDMVGRYLLKGDETVWTDGPLTRAVSRATRKGIGMPIAGMLYWIAVAVVLRTELPLETALVLCFVLTGPVFPIGYAITKAFGGDLFAKSTSLTPFGLQLAALQLFFWPVILVVFYHVPEWTPFTLAVLFGSHFLPYGWMYESRGYPFLTVSLAVVMCSGVLVTGGPMLTLVPVLAAGCYAAAVGMLWWEIRAW